MKRYIIIKDFTLHSDRKFDKQSVPLYDLRTLAGFNSTLIDEENVIDYIEVEDASRCNASIPVLGDSMEPLCTSGDLAVFDIVLNRRGGLFFGDIYVIAFGEDGETSICVKYVYPSKIPGYYRLESENPRHKPGEIW